MTPDILLCNTVRKALDLSPLSEMPDPKYCTDEPCYPDCPFKVVPRSEGDDYMRCPYCGDNIRLIAEVMKWSTRDKVDLWQCRRCKTVFEGPV